LIHNQGFQPIGAEFIIWERIQMRERPELNKKLDAATFRSFYYLKQELADFCKENGLPTSGSKIELTDRIAYFLDTGSVLKSTAERKAAVNIGTLTEDTVIEPNIVCSEKHRAFFCEKIGKSFSFNKELLFARRDTRWNTE